MAQISLSVAMTASTNLLVSRPFSSEQKIAVLVLVENSEEMVSTWPDLRDHHLPNLLGHIRATKPGALIEILIITSATEALDSTGLGPRQYYEFRDVQFNYQSTNRISVGKISYAIDLLNSTFHGNPAERHLIIVAASTPSDAVDSTYANNSSANQPTGWHLLAQKMTQSTINCHMVLNPNNEINAFTLLFYDALRLQGNTEIPPWFAADPEKYLFRLSARPDYVAGYADSIPAPYSNVRKIDPKRIVRNFIEHLQPSYNQDERPLMHRAATYPLDAITPDESAPPTPSSAPESHSDIPEPSIVTRLQQMHGLTKKKIYAAKPTRTPFFRDEPVREKYRQVPTPLSIPICPPSTPQVASIAARETRTPSRSKGDRVRRLSGRNLQGSPIDSQPIPPSHPHSHSQPHSRRQNPWPQLGSRKSSPESDATLSSPTSYSTMSPVLSVPRQFDYFSSNVSSPASPSTADDISSNQPPHGTVSTTLIMPSNLTIGSAEPSWLPTTYPVLPESSSPLGSVCSTLIPSAKAENLQLDLDSFNRIATPEYPMVRPGPPSMYNSNAISPHTRARVNSMQNQTMAVTPHLSSPSYPVDGDSPFIFSPEYEAATEAQMADLQSFTSATPTYPRYTTRNKSFDTSLPYASSSATRNPYSSMHHTRSSSSSLSAPSSRVDLNHSQNGYNYPQRFPASPQSTPWIDPEMVYDPVNTSSLTGWAG